LSSPISENPTTTDTVSAINSALLLAILSR